VTAPCPSHRPIQSGPPSSRTGDLLRVWELFRPLRLSWAGPAVIAPTPADDALVKKLYDETAVIAKKFK
jgi:hypothetical protein